MRRTQALRCLEKAQGLRALTWIVGLVYCLSAGLGRTEEPWIDLFDGESLDGWRANVLPDSWSVQEGAIRAHATRPYSHLFYVGESGREEGAPFDDFILECEVRTEPNSNGGIFIHTGFEAVGSKNKLVRGLEVQINNTQRERRKTGSLYQVVDLAESPVDETDWFSVRITVLGQRVRIEINDRQVVDYIEPEGYAGKNSLQPSGGAIALQAHDPDSVVFYRAIRLQLL